MSEFKRGLWESLSCLVLGLIITLVGVVPEVHAETVEIYCKSSKVQGVDKYLIDTKNKKVGTTLRSEWVQKSMKNMLFLTAFCCN